MEKIVASASPDKVFEFLIDFTRYPAWFDMAGNVLQVEKTSRGPIGEGSTFRVLTAITNVGPFMWVSQREQQRTAKFTKLIQDEQLEVCFDDNLLVTFALRPTATGTQVTIDTRSKSTESPWGWIALAPIYLVVFPVLWLTGRLTAPRRMKRLKKLIESDS